MIQRMVLAGRLNGMLYSQAVEDRTLNAEALRLVLLCSLCLGVGTLLTALVAGKGLAPALVAAAFSAAL